MWSAACLFNRSSNDPAMTPWICLRFLSSAELEALPLPISSLSLTSQGSESIIPISQVSVSSEPTSLSPRLGTAHVPLSSLALGLENPISWMTEKAWITVKSEGELRYLRRQRDGGR